VFHLTAFIPASPTVGGKRHCVCGSSGGPLVRVCLLTHAGISHGAISLCTQWSYFGTIIHRVSEQWWTRFEGHGVRGQGRMWTSVWNTAETWGAFWQSDVLVRLVLHLNLDLQCLKLILLLCHAPLGVHSVIRWHQPPQAARAATPPFDVRSLGLFCGRPGGLQLVTRLPSRTDAFCWQFLSWPENSSFLVLLAYTAH